jgi:hypothetical protein
MLIVCYGRGNLLTNEHGHDYSECNKSQLRQQHNAGKACIVTT